MKASFWMIGAAVVGANWDIVKNCDECSESKA
jgi:hypothetical protein